MTTSAARPDPVPDGTRSAPVPGGASVGPAPGGTRPGPLSGEARPGPVPDEARTGPVPDRTRTGPAPGGARASNTWELSFRLWDSYFAIVWVATLVFVLGTAHPGWHIRLAAGGLLLLLIPWYLLVGRPVLTADAPDERRALGYIVGAVLLFLPPGCWSARPV